MKPQYFAQATFPASAKKISEIAAYADEDSSTGLNVCERDGLIIISEDEAIDGRLEVMDLLEEHNIPFDHYNGEANRTRTDKYRLDENGNLEKVSSGYLSETDEALISLARDVKRVLKNGSIEDAYSILNDVLKDPASIEDIATLMKAAETPALSPV